MDKSARCCLPMCFGCQCRFSSQSYKSPTCCSRGQSWRPAPGCFAPACFDAQTLWRSTRRTHVCRRRHSPVSAEWCVGVLWTSECRVQAHVLPACYTQDRDVILDLILNAWLKQFVNNRAINKRLKMGWLWSIQAFVSLPASLALAEVMRKQK